LASIYEQREYLIFDACIYEQAMLDKQTTTTLCQNYSAVCTTIATLGKHHKKDKEDGQGTREMSPRQNRAMSLKSLETLGFRSSVLSWATDIIFCSNKY
jgi:hypothetical protein